MLIRVVMYGCIIAGSLCSIVSVLSCVAACCKISCGLSAVEINEELLLLLLLLLRSGLCYCKSICRLSVTLVHPTQGIKAFGIIFHRCVPWPSSDLHAKFYGDRPRGTPPSGALNARGVAK